MGLLGWWVDDGVKTPPHKDGRETFWGKAVGRRVKRRCTGGNFFGEGGGEESKTTA